jgi:hypothetical protein
MKSPFLIPLAALAVFGCNQADPDAAAQGNGAKDSPKAVALDAALMHDAYDYNGLGSKDELVYDFVPATGNPPEEGASVVDGPKQGDGEATFTIMRSGSLAQLGDDTVAVRKDGVYLVEGSAASPDKPTLLMPASVEVGTVWDLDLRLTNQGSSVEMTGKNKVERAETIEVPAGKFDTLLVSQSAVLKTSDSTGNVAAKTWYAKGVGIVKMTLEVKQTDGKVVTSSVILKSRKPRAG